MGYIQVGGSNPSVCDGVVAPYGVQDFLKFDAQVAGEEGSTALQLVDELVAGDQFYKGATVVINGCLDALFTFTVWEGGDCKECTTDTLTSKTYTKIVKGGTNPATVYEFGDFYWSGVTVQLVDQTGSAVNLTGDLTELIEIDSEYVEKCPACVKVVPV